MQLLWQPDVSLINDNMEKSFFTSDVSGDFEIKMEGFNREGYYISVKNYFKVN